MNSVRQGGVKINTVVTSKEAILKTCCALVSEKGLASLNMRAVAKSCGVALGTLYYYFPSKDELLIATIESVWQDIFHIAETEDIQLTFPGYVKHLFERIWQGTNTYPNFFTLHSISFANTGQTKARQAMERYLFLLKASMMQVLRKDARLRTDAFSLLFTEENFIDFVLGNMLYLLLQQKKDCEILLEIVRRSIYSD